MVHVRSAEENVVVLRVQYLSLHYVTFFQGPTCNGESSGRGVGCSLWQHLKNLSMQASFSHKSWPAFFQHILAEATHGFCQKERKKEINNQNHKPG